MRALAFGGVAFGGLVVAPRSLWEILHFDGRHDGFAQPLQADLMQLGGPALSGKVQCLDMASGCIATLYEMKLAESSGFLYDCYLYTGEPTQSRDRAERDRYRLAFQNALLTHPPRVLVVSSDECGPADFAYKKLTQWPWLGEYLEEHYELAQNETPQVLEQWGGKPALPYGYRIYVAKPVTPY